MAQSSVLSRTDSGVPSFSYCILCLKYLQLPPDLIKIIVALVAHTSRELIGFKAKLCEQAERYDEMAAEMSALVPLGLNFTVEERNLLSVAYKNLIGVKRASWRILTSLASKEEAKGNQKYASMAVEYSKRIEDEIARVCSFLISQLNHLVVDHACYQDHESVIFFHKMRGDYYRYIAEFTINKNQKEYAQDSLDAYNLARELATQHLRTTHPIRLGLGLNMSVFYYEILNQPEQASKMAKQTFDDAIQDLDNLDEESYKDSTLIMQLMRDSLTLWTSDMEPEDEEEADAI